MFTGAEHAVSLGAFDRGKCVVGVYANAVVIARLLHVCVASLACGETIRSEPSKSKGLDRFTASHSCHDRVMEDTLTALSYQGSSTGMEVRMSVFSAVLAFWDPVLATVLVNRELPPELYAVSWFVTLLSDVVPIEKIPAGVCVCVMSLLIIGALRSSLLIGHALQCGTRCCVVAPAWFSSSVWRSCCVLDAPC
jgi:hypothetical protein